MEIKDIMCMSETEKECVFVLMCLFVYLSFCLSEREGNEIDVQ